MCQLNIVNFHACAHLNIFRMLFVNFIINIRDLISLLLKICTCYSKFVSKVRALFWCQILAIRRALFIFVWVWHRLVNTSVGMGFSK